MRTATRILSTLAALLCSIALVTACAPATAPTGEAQRSWLSDFDLDGLDARAVIDRLDALPVTERPGDLIASVQPDALLLSDGEGHQTSLDMPEDEFYVSVAPYAERTHDCFFHSLTTCLGELAGKNVDVTVVDAAGTVILDESVRTYDNGFVGLWLPRDLDATLTISHDGRTATSPISTASDAPTCLTTLQLT